MPVSQNGFSGEPVAIPMQQVTHARRKLIFHAKFSLAQSVAVSTVGQNSNLVLLQNACVQSLTILMYYGMVSLYCNTHTHTGQMSTVKKGENAKWKENARY